MRPSLPVAIALKKIYRPTATLALAAAIVAAVAVQAAELRVMTSGAFTAPYLELAPQFEQTRAVKVVTLATSMGVGEESIPSRIQRGDPVDVVILPDAAVDDLIRAGRVIPGSKVAVARSAIGMAVRAGAPRPDISSVDALKRTLLQAKSIAYSASVSGDYLSNELFARLGIADQVKAKSKRIERERVGAVVARGDAEIGFQQVSELLPVPGIDYVGPLPPDAQRVTVISAAVVDGPNRDAALAFVGYLASPAAIPAIRKSGLEPVSVAATGAAQSERADDYITIEMQRQRIPGLSLAIVKDGKIVKAQGYGVSDMKARTPATPETVYKIGSVSKQFIAAGIMLLVQQGQLSVSDPISKFLEGTPETWKAITIRHLLTHTSGIVREAPGFEPFKIQSDADVVKSAYGVPLRFAPGEKWEYGNTGYFALAEIIRKAAGIPWHDYLAQNVFKPAGMNSTYATHVNLTTSNRAVGYSDNDKLQPAVDWSASRPSGAFFSTVSDLARWDAVLYTDAILRDMTRRQMWTPVTLNNGNSHPYGFGWELNAFDGRRRVHHGGGIPGFQSEFARFVDDRLTVIVLINLDDADVEGIAGGVAALYLPGR